MIRLRNTKIQNGLILMLLGLLFISCNDTTKTQNEEKIYPVEAITIEKKSAIRQVNYVGRISTNIINYSFATGGRVGRIFVRKNQSVTPKTKLIQLETKAYNLAVNASKRQESQAKAAYNQANAYYSKLKKANKLGGVSNLDIENAKLDRDVKLQTWEQAKIDVKAKQIEWGNTILYAKTNGVVADIIPKVGELVGAGSETIIVRETGTFVETAVSQKDLEHIKVGTNAIIDIKGQKLKGKVSYVSDLPDLQTFRHTVKIAFTEKHKNQTLPIGQTVRIAFETDSVSGYWIPLNYISNDGADFIYVVENNRMRKRKIQIIDFSNNLARVSGLNENEPIIIKGAYNIKEGYQVKVVNNGE